MIVGLSLSGGGYKGLVSALILEELERRLGEPLIDYIDYTAGNSTGSIILGLLNIESENGEIYSCTDIVELYKELGKKVFKKFSVRKLLTLNGLLAYKYSAKAYEQLLHRFFEDVTLADLKTTSLVLSYEIKTNQPKFFKTRLARKNGENYFVRDVVRASSAAPTYFKPLVLNGETFIDGSATSNNNPALCMTSEMLRFKKPEEEMLIISIGTGIHKPNYYQKSLEWAGIAGFAIPYFSMLGVGSDMTVDYQLKQICATNSHQYFCFNPDIPDVGMDDATDEATAKLEIAAKDFIIKNSAQFDELVAILKANGKAKREAV